MTSENPARWQRVKAIFDRIVDVPSAERPAALEAECAGDPTLRADVQRLLQLDAEPDLSLDRVAGGLLPPAARSLLHRFQPGEILAARYRILRFVAAGGMGEVYEAFDAQEQRRVALKFVGAPALLNPTGERRFLREVEIAMRIRHPNVCPTYALESHAGQRFCVMQFLDGETLADRLARGEHLSPEAALPLALQLCDGLEAAHRAGVIHRDLKPGNIFLTAQGPVIIDFGLASAVAEPGSLTTAGAVIGTLAYMAPEQLEKDHLTPAADIYALGVIFFEAITGQKPHAAKSPFRLASQKAREAHLNPLSSAHHLTPLWREAIGRCLKARPEQRFTSAPELRSLLARGRPTLRFTAARHARRLAIPLAAAALAAASFAGWRLYTTGHQPPAQAAQLYAGAQAALNASSPVQAVRLLEQAIQIDPQFLQARAALAVAYADLDQLDSAREAVLLAQRASSSAWFHGRNETEALAAAREAVVRDFAQAAAHYHRLASWTHGRDRSYALASAARMIERSGKPADALGIFETVVKEDPGNTAARVRLAVLLCRRREFDRAAALFERAEADYQASRNLEGLSDAILARIAALRSETPAHNRRDLQHVIDLSRQTGNRYHAITAQFRLGIVAETEKDYDRAIEITRDAAAQAQQEGLPVLAARALGELGYAFAYQKKVKESAAILREAVKAAERAKAYETLASNRMRLGEVLYSARQVPEAVAVMEPAVEWYRNAHYDDVLPIILIKWGTNLSAVDRSRAEQAYREALALARRQHEPFYEALVQARLCEFHILDDFRAAARNFAEALPSLKAFHISKSLYSAAFPYTQLGDFQKAEALIADADRDVAEHQKGTDREYFFDRGRTFRAEMALYQLDCAAAQTHLNSIQHTDLATLVLKARLIACRPGASPEPEIRETIRLVERALSAAPNDPVTSSTGHIGLALLFMVRRDWPNTIQHAQLGIAAAHPVNFRVRELENLLILRKAHHKLGRHTEIPALTAKVLENSRLLGFDPPAQFGGHADFRQLWNLD